MPSSSLISFRHVHCGYFCVRFHWYHPGSWDLWFLPGPGSFRLCYHWQQPQLRQCQHSESRSWEPEIRMFQTKIDSKSDVPENSPHWTTSHRWSIVGWTEFHWDRGSCTWSESCCRQEHKCGKPDSQRLCQRSTLLSGLHRQTGSQEGSRRWDSPLLELRGYFGLKIEHLLLIYEFILN